MQLSQSTILVGSLLGAFVVYLAMNNRLAIYWGILAGSTAAGSAGSGSSSTSSSIFKNTPLCWLGGSGC
jgi:hypothetical protein